MIRTTRMSTSVGSLLLGVLLSLDTTFGAQPGTGKPLAPGEPPSNRVLSLNGESDFVCVADSPSLHSFKDAITIEAWINATSFAPDSGQISCVIRKDITPNDEDFLLRFRTIDGRAWLEASLGGKIGQVRAGYDFEPGKWYHLVATYNGSAIAVYVNGDRLASEIATGELSIDKADLFIGKGDPAFSSGEFFHGMLDEIRLWNVARAETEIRETMKIRLAGTEQGLVAYWNFDDGTANDLTANGNHGLFPLVVESLVPDPEAAAARTAQAGTTQNQTGTVRPEGSRERARDRVVSIEEGILREIPQVARLCDSMNIRKENVDIGDSKLYCEQEGRGVPLVLLHGGPGATHHDFHPYFSRAVSFARVIYYDQRGCGLSEYKPGDGYCVDQAVDDLDRLRRALGLDQWVALGHSYGGLLAQCYAVKYPQNVKGLVLVGASTGLHGKSMLSRQGQFISQPESDKMIEICKTAGLSTAQVVYNNFLNGDWKRQCYYKPTREQIAQTALFEWVHDNDFNEIMSRSADAVDLAGAFEQCPIPTLIIEGMWDMTWNTDKPQRLGENHPNARLVVFSESGHSPFEDEPIRFFGMLKEFMETLREAPPLQLQYWKGSVTASTASPTPQAPTPGRE